MVSGLHSSQPFSALLLAGGRSRRMGVDKAMLDCDGVPLWRVQMGKLMQLKPHRLLVGCREEQGLHEDRMSPQGIEWVFDPPEEDLGPLPCIHRALLAVQMPLLVLAVDMPGMTSSFLLHHLLGKTQSGKGLFYHGAYGHEPLAGVYDPSMREVGDALARGQYSLQTVIKAAVTGGHAHALRMTDEVAALFQNTNTREEWKSSPHSRRK